MGIGLANFFSEILLFYRKYDRIELIQPNNCISGSGKIRRVMKKVIKMYLHSSKEDNVDKFVEEFLDGDDENYDEVPDKFRYALYEVEFEMEVDSETGDYKILKVNGSELVE
jgi:hypothetical protein